jgi:glycosyltransferase involved in cell wall biosynthesis
MIALSGGGSEAGSVETSTPLVSVVIPVRNGAAYLDDAITSARGQTLEQIEIIIVDDGSTDESAAVARRHADEDPRVRLVEQQHAGLAMARNHGMRAARAPWIALLDSDDIAAPMRLEREVDFLRSNPGVAAVGTYGWHMGSRGHRFGVVQVGPTDVQHLERLRAAGEVIYLLTPSAMFSRDIALELGGFRESQGFAEDVDLWTRMAEHHLVLALPERLLSYRVHAQSSSTTHFFRQMRNTLLVRENAQRRRRGLEELDEEAFATILAQRPLPERVRVDLEWRSQYCYRKAGGLLIDRRPSGLAWLVLSFAWAPYVPIRRMRRQVWPWVSEQLLRRRAGGRATRT